MTDETSARGTARISRRDVLRKGGAAALAVAATHAAAQDAPARKAGRTMDKVRIGVVGGGFGRSFYWHDHPDCVVQAVSDLRTDRRNALMKTCLLYTSPSPRD